MFTYYSRTQLLFNFYLSNPQAYVVCFNTFKLWHQHAYSFKWSFHISCITSSDNLVKHLDIKCLMIIPFIFILYVLAQRVKQSKHCLLASLEKSTWPGESMRLIMYSSLSKNSKRRLNLTILKKPLNFPDFFNYKFCNLIQCYIPRCPIRSKLTL